MPRELDEKWVGRLAKEFPPEGYKLTVPEVFAILDYKNDMICAMSTCYNYGFRRGRNCERNRAARRRLGRD